MMSNAVLSRGRDVLRTVQRSRLATLTKPHSYHRCFSELNGKGLDVIDKSKFTHEVKVIMPDVGEGADVKGT